ncbi:hypothetical protein I546_3802 [Mycobacterium kansasii 732]|nr:hypothetical protein I546_3802 [Mycobacterium kansasii 732]
MVTVCGPGRSGPVWQFGDALNLVQVNSTGGHRQARRGGATPDRRSRRRRPSVSSLSSLLATRGWGIRTAASVPAAPADCWA